MEGITFAITSEKSVIVTFPFPVDTTCDNSTAQATIKGTEPSSDLAVVAVKIQDLSEETMKNIKIAALGDSEQVKVGEMAIAIGNL